MKPPEAELKALVFHAQQTAEKYWKALLVLHQVEFSKTHDIEKLLRLLGTVQSEIIEPLLDAKGLTPFGVNVRYPGDFPETLPGDENRAVELAGRVRGAVMTVLEPYLSGG